MGTSLGARHGLLIRGGDVLERAAKVDTVLFDKTGTLTRGKPVVTEVTVLEEGGRKVKDVSERRREVLGLAAAVERLSSHPLATAVVNAAAAADSPRLSVSMENDR